ncbi:DUF2397 family protein [Streptomyces sp. LBL]|uniref:DUF2397 family protein n=1 Tax=Streptomyces sp. LBL TaxID=2940562 RepID=UPI00247568F1|nr:DUF2397 family protein [Streptomyces sp. LBL]
MTDARKVVGYLVRPESSEYIAIMDVLEGSVTDLTVAEVAAALSTSGVRLDTRLVEKRLDALKDMGAVSFRSDTSHARRYAEILARNWRYTASPAGRHVQRFYRQVLAGTVTAREIPIVSLSRIVSHLEQLATALGIGEPDAGRLDAAVLDAVSTVFTSHDDLDAALVGAEDALIGLADRFDLDEERTNDLKGLLVDYATRVAAELDSGSARAAAALVVLRPWFGLLAQAAVDASQARDLIAAGTRPGGAGPRYRCRHCCAPPAVPVRAAEAPHHVTTPRPRPRSPRPGHAARPDTKGHSPRSWPRSRASRWTRRQPEPLSPP